MNQILVTHDPATNGVKVESGLAPGDIVILLERAKAAVVAAVSRERSPIQQPAPAEAKKLLGAG